MNDILSQRFVMDLPSAKITEKSIEQQIKDEVEKNYPVSKEKYKEQIVQEAKKRFPMVKFGEKLTIISPRYKTFSGTFYGFSEHSKSIRINSKNIAIIDLSPNTRAQVDPEFNEQTKNKFIKNECDDYNQKIETFKRQVKKNLMEERGYFSLFDTFYSPAEYLSKLQKYGEKQEPPQEKKQTAEEELENEISQ